LQEIIAWQSFSKIKHFASQTENIPVDIEKELADDPSSYEEEELKTIELNKLNEALESLNTEQKTCVQLFYFENIATRISLI